MDNMDGEKGKQDEKGESARRRCGEGREKVEKDEKD
jgi:hypothetical protein